MPLSIELEASGLESLLFRIRKVSEKRVRLFSILQLLVQSKKDRKHSLWKLDIASDRSILASLVVFGISAAPPAA